MSSSSSVAELSPKILCVSDSHEAVGRIRESVVSYCPADTIETTSDPTVVPTLVDAWDVNCVVADAAMAPLDGEDLRSTVRKQTPQVAVIVVSATDSADTTSVSAVGEDSDHPRPLSEQLAQLDHTETATVSTADPRAERRLRELLAAENRCDLLAALECAVSTVPGVTGQCLWLAQSADGQLEAAADAIESAPPPTVAEAYETGISQIAPPETATVNGESRTEQHSAVIGAYPLGQQGIVAVSYETHTPEMAATVARLAAVAGGCLDQMQAYTALETRFRRTAERNRTLSQFARTVAHDLNSPLSVIYGRIELALATETDTELHLRAALNAAQRVDSLITDHLQSIETVDTESETESVSIQTVAIQAWRIIDPSTARLQVEPQLETVEANAIRLQQLFENLIRNAIEHGSEESIGLGSTRSRDPHAVFDDDTESVTVTIKPTDCGFAVCDDGPGIPPADRETIFESGYTTTESGSGLGLHIVEEIADSHGWEISVTESESGGARFEVDTQ